MTEEVKNLEKIKTTEIQRTVSKKTEKNFQVEDNNQDTADGIVVFFSSCQQTYYLFYLHFTFIERIKLQKNKKSMIERKEQR